MEFRKKCTHVLRLIVGWFLTALGGISGVSSAACAFVVLFGGMGIDSFRERLIVFATTFVMAIGFFIILWLGIRLKNRSLRDKTAPINHTLLTRYGDFEEKSLSLYMVQCDVAYSDDGLECCSISSQEIDKDSWTHQTDGKTFHYYNSFCCPHCGTPYIDYQKFPENKKFGVSGCVHLGRELYYDTPKKLKQESDTAKDQKIADEREEMKKIYNDFINGEGRLPEGFSEKYNRTVQGYILHETPFKKYLDEIYITIDALNDRTGISDWIYFDGRIEINSAIELITDWVRRHREMNARLRASKVGFRKLKQDIYCEQKIMVVMENEDTFRSVAERSIVSCKAEQISFCTILSECELYDLIEHKVKTIEYISYPGYHDETYADWWLEDSPAGANIG